MLCAGAQGRRDVVASPCAHDRHIVGLPINPVGQFVVVTDVSEFGIQIHIVVGAGEVVNPLVVMPRGTHHHQASRALGQLQ